MPPEQYGGYHWDGEAAWLYCAMVLHLRGEDGPNAAPDQMQHWCSWHALLIRLADDRVADERWGLGWLSATLKQFHEGPLPVSDLRLAAAHHLFLERRLPRKGEAP